MRALNSGHSKFLFKRLENPLKHIRSRTFFTNYVVQFQLKFDGKLSDYEELVRNWGHTPFTYSSVCKVHYCVGEIIVPIT